ncbi:MAG TPA: hypothetical protein VGO93_06495 [Candidatus Xenobia bacterium]
MIELVVASALLAVVLTTVLSIWHMMNRTSAAQQADREGRQVARTALDFLSSEVQTADLIWTGTNTVNGHVYHVPAPSVSGTDLLYASPEDGTTWRVSGVYLAPMNDSTNPGAQEIVVEQFAGVTPVRPGEPASIDLQSLTTPHVRTFLAFLPAGNWLTVSSPPRGVGFDMTFFRVVPHGPVESEHLVANAVMRDGL